MKARVIVMRLVLPAFDGRVAQEEEDRELTRLFDESIERMVRPLADARLVSIEEPTPEEQAEFDRRDRGAGSKPAPVRDLPGRQAHPDWPAEAVEAQHRQIRAAIELVIRELAPGGLTNERRAWLRDGLQELLDGNAALRVEQG